jgi:HSP90 family molecular chaperone
VHGGLQKNSKKATAKHNARYLKQEKYERFYARMTETTLDPAHAIHQWFMTLVTSACEF